MTWVKSDFGKKSVLLSTNDACVLLLKCCESGYCTAQVVDILCEAFSIADDLTLPYHLSILLTVCDRQHKQHASGLVTRGALKTTTCMYFLTSMQIPDQGQSIRASYLQSAPSVLDRSLAQRSGVCRHLYISRIDVWDSRC